MQAFYDQLSKKENHDENQQDWKLRLSKVSLDQIAVLQETAAEWIQW